MFFYFYPLNGLAAYEYGTAMGRMLMDMKAIADRQKNTGNAELHAMVSLAPPPLPQDTNEEVETDDSCQRSTH